MNLLVSFVAFLFYITGGIAALALTLILIHVIVIYTIKAIRLLVALVNYSIAEPEAEIIRNVQKLNISAARKTAKKKKGKK